MRSQKRRATTPLETAATRVGVASIGLASIGLASIGLALVAPKVAAQSSGTEVPLAVVGGRLAVTVHDADGAAFVFALTTGSPVTVLTESTALALGPGARLDLGGVPVSLDHADTIPDERLVSGGTAFAGMVGVNTLGDFDILLDAPGGRLILEPVGPTVSWPGTPLSDPLPVRVYHGVVIGLDVRLNGRELQAMLDLGTPQLVVNEGARPDGLRGAEGTASLALGGVTLEGLPLSVRDLPVFERWDPTNRGFVLVGAAIAYDCAVSLSWARGEMRTCLR
jgi:hypothetical protein